MSTLVHRELVGSLIALVLTIGSTHESDESTTREMISPREDPAFFEAKLSDMERQARRLIPEGEALLQLYFEDVAPIEEGLLRRARDPQTAKAVAIGVVRAAKERHLPTELVAAIIQVENPWLVLDTTSYAGAIGLMQVMPMHLRNAAYVAECGDDLADGFTSLCYGSNIFRLYLGEEIDRAINRALLRYNGCVSTPGCESYATLVLSKVSNEE